MGGVVAVDNDQYPEKLEVGQVEVAEIGLTLRMAEVR